MAVSTLDRLWIVSYRVGAGTVSYRDRAGKLQTAGSLTSSYQGLTGDFASGLSVARSDNQLLKIQIQRDGATNVYVELTGRVIDPNSGLVFADATAIDSKRSDTGANATNGVHVFGPTQASAALWTTEAGLYDRFDIRTKADGTLTANDRVIITLTVG